MRIRRPRQPYHTAGFTLIEILMVVLIISFLLAIAAPSFVQAREVSRAHACAENLRKIEQAKHQYVMDHNTSTFADVTGSSDTTLGGLYPTYLRGTPQCQAGGIYSTGDMNADPSCDLATGNPPRFGKASPYPHTLP